MKIVSWDVGIYNLAYCVLEKDNNTDFEILNWDVISINPIEIKEKIICSQTLINKKKCKAKAQFYTKNKSYYCTRHSKKTNTKLISIKPVKKKKVPLFDLGKRMIDELNKLPFLLDVDQCVIENQPVLKNPKMKSIQMILYSYFLINGVCKDTSPLKTIKLCSARNKLKVYDGPPVEIKCKNKYTKTKKLGIEYCKYFINNRPLNIDFFLTHKKKDDLTDSMLQGLWFLRHNK